VMSVCVCVLSVVNVVAGVRLSVCLFAVDAAAVVVAVAAAVVSVVAFAACCVCCVLCVLCVCVCS